MQVGWIGGGAQAAEGARRLLAGGTSLRAWMDDATRLPALRAAGAAVAESPEDIARGSEVLLVDLPHDADVRELLLGAEGLLPQLAAETVVISLAAATTAQAEEIAGRMAQRRVTFVDAPALGPADATAGVRALAGPADACARVLPLLQLLAGRVVRCGSRPGDAQIVRLIDRTMTIAAGLGSMEAFAAGRRRGLPLHAMIDVLSLGSGRNFTTRSVLPALARGGSALQVPVAQLLRDIDEAIALGIAQGIPTPIASVARAQLQMAANELGGEASFEAVAERVAALAGTRMRDEGEPAATAPKSDGTAGSAPRTIGYVGLGAMGVPLARRLLGRYQVQVFDLRPEGPCVLEAEGAVVARDLPSMARACDIVMLCLPSSSIVQQVLFGPEGLAQGLGPGKVVIDQTTGDPDLAVAFAARLQQLGVALVEAPVAGGPETPGNGTAFLMCGGDRAAFDGVRPVLQTIGPNVQYCGPTGSGHAAKLVNNASNICNRLIAYEAAVFGVSLGLGLEVLHEAINASSGWSFASERVFKAVATQGRTATISLELSLKDIASAVKMGMRCHAPMQIADTVRSLFAMGVHRLGGEVNVDEIARLFEELGGVRFAGAWEQKL